MKPDLTKLAGKNVVITGATGFIGSNLIRSLKSSGAIVIAPERNELSWIPTDVDVIVHAAGYAQPALFMANPLETIWINTEVTNMLLNRLKPGSSFLFCSSSEVYSGLFKPASETDIGTTTPEHPRAAYIEGKRCGEAIVNAWRKMGIQASSARISLAYGPGTRAGDTRVLNQFIEKALKIGRIDLLDSGLAMRTYCYIDDITEMLWNIVLSGTQAVYNVGGRSPISIQGLAAKIARLTGAKINFPSAPTAVAGAPQGVCLDLSRAEAEFGKTEYIDLDEGLKRTIEYQRGLYA